MSGTLLAILGYVLLQLVLGAVIARRVHTEQDYLVAGRSLGPWLSTFTVFATWFGAETCIGAAGEAYGAGLYATTADPFGYGLCLLLMGVVFAVPLWKRGLTTLADLFRTRFGPNTEQIAALLMVPTSVMWAAAQIRAFGQVLGASSSLSLHTAIAVATAVVIVYTAMGGLLADAYSDVIQGSVLLLGLIIVFAAMLWSGDGATLATLNPSAWSLIEPHASLWEVLDAWAIPIFGSVVAQELIARVIAARSPDVARSAAIRASVIYVLVGVIPVVLGLSASAVLPGLSNKEQALAHMAAHYLPDALYVVFVGALVSAILSTVDSALLAAGALVAHNMILPRWPEASEGNKLLLNRIFVVLSGLTAYALALSADSVYSLVEEASAISSAGIFVCLVFALFTPIGAAFTAGSTMLAGVTVYAMSTHLLHLRAPYLAALASATCVYLAAAAFESEHARRKPASTASDTSRILIDEHSNDTQHHSAIAPTPPP